MQDLKTGGPAHRAKAGSLRPLLLFLLLAIGGMVLALLWPRGSYLLVVAPPSSPPAAVMAIIARADGALVQQGRLDWLAVAYSESPDFAARLRAAGALVVLASPLKAGCLMLAAAAR